MIDGAQTLGSRLDALSALASEPSSTRRRELLRDVTDLFFAPTPPPPQVMALFDSALEKMTDALEVELRAELATRLAPVATTPLRLVSRLVGDESDSVAEPILASAPRLSEADLLCAVAAGGQARLRTASRRSDLTEAVSDRIVERGDDVTVGVLVANPSAPLSRGAAEAVIDRALANPDLHAAVVARETLPLDLLNEMYFSVEARLRERIAARNARVDPAMLEEALRASRTRMATRTGALPPDYEEAVAAVGRLGRGPVAPQALVGFIREVQTTRFLVALAQSAELDFETVRRVHARRDFDALMLVCRATGYDAALFRTLALLLGPDPETPVVTLVHRYTELDPETARRVLRFWKVRSTALAA
ncbi:MAG: DUF2336 domain-containing protein [Caulobacteraceae bacterium]|nr:DUF2336 domain-containing protein [Caulobacter sp.]